MSRPNINKLVQDQKINTTNNEEPKSTGSSILDDYKIKDTPTDPILDMIDNSKAGGVKDTGETKFINTDEYTEYTQKEDKGVSPFAFSSNYDLSRALNQSNWEQAGHVAAKVIPNAILEFTGMVGNVLDLEDYANSDDEVGNWLNTWAQEKKQQVNDTLPIYRENEGKAFDTGDFAWWMENGSALVESAAAFVGLGYLTGGAALRTLSGGAKGLEFLGFLAEGGANADKVKRIVQGGAGLLNNYMLNHGEGVGIAVSVYDTSYQEEIAKLQEAGETEGIEDKARLIASKKATKALNFNKANMLLNATSSFAFLRTPSLARTIYNNPTLKNSLKHTLGESFQEFGEEIVNLGAENAALQDDSDFGTLLDESIASLGTAEGWEAGVLGFAGGGLQTGLTNAGREIKSSKRPDGSRYSTNDLARERALSQEEAKQRWDNLSQEQKMDSTSDLFMSAKQLTEMHNQLGKIDTQIQEADKNKDVETANKLRLQAQEIAKNTFNSKAYHAFSTGTTEQLEGFYKSIATMTAEEAKQKNLPDTYKETSQAAIVKLKSLEAEYNKAENYVNSSDIYSNRARNISAREEEKELTSYKSKVQSELDQDLSDIGIKDLANYTNEEGNFDINKLSNENKAIVKDLDSYNKLQSLDLSLKRNSRERTYFAKEYSNLISNDYQKAFKEDLKSKKQKDKASNSIKKAKTAKKEATTTAKNKTEDFKKEAEPTVTQEPKATTNTTEAPVENKPEEVDQSEQYEPATDTIFSTKLAAMVNNEAAPLEWKVNKLNEQIAATNPKNTSTIQEMKEALAFLGAPVKDAKQNTVDAQLDDFASFVENNAPSVLPDDIDLAPSEDKTLEKITKLINLMGSLKERGVNTSNFNEVAKYMQNSLGKERFLPLYKDIQAIYNLTKQNPVWNEQSYEDIFYTAKEKADVVKDNKINYDAALPEGYYNYDNESINELNRQVNVRFLEGQGYKVFKGDNLSSAGIKTIEGYNKLAHLDKQYSNEVTVGKTGTFNVLNFINTKQDLSNYVDGSTDQKLLDYNVINIGSELTFRVLDEVVYDDGTIAYADGRLEKNGDFINEGEDLANQYAPIGVFHDGVQLENTYLHTVEWINENNIVEADDVRNQKNKLYEIRRKVLAAGEKGLTTVVDSRNDGILLRNKDGIKESLTTRIPNATIAIGKDNVVYSSDTKAEAVINRELYDGVVYAVLPVNKGRNLAVALNRPTIASKPEYVNSMVEAMRLYLGNDVNETRTAKLYDDTSIDITTEQGLYEYLSKFIFLPSKLPKSSSDFADYLSNQNEGVSLVRIQGETIDFGRGAGIAGGAKFINRKVLANIKDDKKRNRTIDAQLSNFKKTLESGMHLQIDKKSLGKDFQLPIISKDTVTTNTQNYNDYLKDNLTTDLYSHTLDNGREIYTIQSNVEFNSDFSENNISEATQEAALGVQEDTDVQEKNLTDTELANPDLFGDLNLAPSVMTEEQVENFVNTTPNSLLIPGVSIKVQTALIEYLSARVIEEQDTTPFKELKDQLKVAREAYDTVSKTTTDLDKKAKLENLIDAIDSVNKQYSKLEDLVYTSLLQYNGLKLDGKKLVQAKEIINQDDNIDESENVDTDESESNRWNRESVFTEDGKVKASIEVKNAISHVKDVKGFNIVNGVRVPIINKTVFGLDNYILFDEIFNEVSGILAFNNFDTDKVITKPSIDSMVEELGKWVDTKPYLFNVIEKIKAMDEKTQNSFVGVMNKHFTNHKLVYKRGKFNTKTEKYETNYFINDSDTNSVSKVVQNAWLQNLINGELIKVSDFNYVIDKDAFDSVKAKSIQGIELIKSPDTTKEGTAILSDVLTFIGIDLDQDIINSIQRSPIDYGKGSQSLLHLFTNSDGAIKIYMDTLESLVNKDIQETNPFSNNSSLNGFAREIAKRSPKYFSNSFKDVRGRTYYSYSLNKFMIDRIKELKSNPILRENLAKQPFSSNSYWMSIDQDKFNKYFGYGTFDGTKEAGKTGKKLSQMSPAEHEEAKVALFFNRNKRNKTTKEDYLIEMFYPTTSDKGVQMTVNTLGINFASSVSPRTGKLSPKGVDWLYRQLIEPEINRIIAFEENTENSTTKGFVDGANTINLFPEVNTIEGVFIVEDGVRKINPVVKTDEKIKNRIKEYLAKYVDDEVQDKIKTWTDYGFVNTNSYPEWDMNGQEFTIVENDLSILGNVNKSISNVNNAAHNYVANYLLGNMNIMQTMITDPANYFKSSQFKNVAKRLVDQGVLETTKNVTRNDVLGYYETSDFIVEHEALFNNMGKRLAADIAPGTDLPIEDNEVFNVAHILDSERMSSNYEYYKSLLGEKAAKGYTEVNTTDAQEFTTLEEDLLIKFKEGKIDYDTMQDLLDREDSQSLTNKDYDLILQPTKPVYVNNVFRGNTEHRVYIKSSSFPLIKQLTKGLEIDKLRKAMIRDGVDRVAFDSAIKTGGTTAAPSIYNGEGNLNDDIDLTDSTLTLKRQGFKIQQQVPYKETDYINDGSQQRKLLTAAVRNVTGFKLRGSNKPYTGAQVQEAVDNTYNKIFEIKHDSLMKELGFNAANETIDLEKVQKVLQTEGLSRNYPLYDLEGFNLNKEGTDFIVPLWLNASSEKIEAMLNSIVDNRVRKFKPKGRSYVLGTSEGMKPVIVEGTDATEEIKNTSNIGFNKEWRDRNDGVLRNARVENGVFMPAEIMIPFRFKDDKGNKLSMDKFVTDGFMDLSKIDEELLSSFGFRIPTQGLNSMSYVKVVGWLPESSGDLFLAPADWTIQMGSDFDVDKIFTNSFNTSFNEGKLTRYKGDDELTGLENDLLDLHLSILSNPAEEVQNKIIKPLDFGMLGELANEIYPLVREGLEGRGLTESYQKFKYINARAGAIGIGVFSNDSTFNALAQGKNLKVQNYNEKMKGFEDFFFTLMGKSSNQISDTNTVTNKNRSKSEVIAAYQSMAVDNEKEQGMHKLNVNSYTFDAIRTLAMMGFEEDSISYFLNQPIIRDYVKFKTLADDNATDYNTTDLAEYIAKTYPVTDPDYIIEKYIPSDKDYYLSNIKGKIDTNFQKAILDFFDIITEKGKDIQSIQSAINTDSAGLGKNLFYSFEKMSQVLKLGSKNSIINADKLIGNYTSLPEVDADNNLITPLNRDSIKVLEEEGYIAVTAKFKGNKLASNIQFIKPTTINGFTSVRALSTNNKLWEEFFPYKALSVQIALSDIKGITNQTNNRIAQNAQLNSDLFKVVKSYMIASKASTYTNESLDTAKARLLMHTKNNTSLGNVLKTIINKGYNSNPFLNRLEIDGNKEVLPNLITYQASAAENINERGIYAGFSSMFTDNVTDLGTFNGIQYTPQKLAQDLVTYSLITGGVQQATQFVKFIPINYLQSIGFYDEIKSINLDNQEEVDYNDLTRQYVQHNYKDVAIRNLPKFIEDGLVLSPDKESFTFASKSKKLKLAKFIAIKSNETVAGFKLYERGDSNKWNRISTLGYNNMLEYGSNNSVVSSNNAKEVPVDILPTEPTKFNTEVEQEVDTELIRNKIPQSVTDTYKLNSKEAFVPKMQTVLNTIIDNNSNAYNTLMAKEVLANLDKISDFKFLLSTNLKADGGYSMKSKMILINPDRVTNNKLFEKTILEELIHAMTKPALLANSTGEVNRLVGFKNKAIQLVKKQLGDTADTQFEAVRTKLANGESLTSKEANLIYPLLNEVEFVGRLFKSKELQELLNNKVSDKGTNILQDFFNFIRELLNKAGLNIKKDSALEYAMVDIISLINQPDPSAAVQKDMKDLNPTNRTIEFINNQYDLILPTGMRKVKQNPQLIADSINNTITNIKATAINNSVKLEYINKVFKDGLSKEDYNEGKQLGLFEESVNNRKYYTSNIKPESNTNVTSERTINVYWGQAESNTSTRILSNLAPRTFIYESTDGVEREYGSVEHAYQTNKNGVFNESVYNRGKNDYVGNKKGFVKLTEKGKRGNLQLMKDLVVESFIQNPNSEASKKLMQYKNFTHNTNTLIDRVFLEGLKLAQQELSNSNDFDLAPTTSNSKNEILLKSFRDRLSTIKSNISKAKSKQDIDKVVELTTVLDNLTERYHDAVKIGAKVRLVKIAEKGKQDMEELQEFFENDRISIEDTHYMRNIIHFWETATDTLFDEDERESEQLVELYSTIEGKARYYSDKLAQIEKEYMEDFIAKYGKATTLENIFNHFKDINYAQQIAMDISRVDNELLNSVFMAVQKANVKSIDDTKTLLENLDEKEEKIVAILKSKGYSKDDLYELFKQKTKSGNLTGKMVHRYSDSFNKSLNNLIYNLEEDRDFDSYSELMQWTRNNTKNIKLGYLFSTGKFTKEEQVKVNEYKKQLKEELGETFYNEFIEDQQAKIDNYNKQKEQFVTNLMASYNMTSTSEFLSNEKTSKALTFWEKANSPYNFYKQHGSSTDQSLTKHKGFGSSDHITFIANDNHLDNSFKEIAADKDLYDFYKYYNDIDKMLKSFMSAEDRKKLIYEGVPFIEKNLLSVYSDKGMKAGFAPLYDELKKAVRTNAESNIFNKTVDPVTGKEKNSLSVNLSANTGTEYIDRLNLMSIEYLNENGISPTPEQTKIWGEQIKNDIASRKSFDLPKILKVYALSVLAYKHKVKIEDHVKLAQTTLDNAREYRRNKQGELFKQENGKLADPLPLSESFVKTKKQFNYFVESFYGKGNKEEGVTKKKVLTSKEKETKANIENELLKLETTFASKIITADTYNNLKKKLNTQLDSLGGYAVWSKRGDQLLKYIQLKGMGWNVMSSIANVGFGTIANMIEGAGNQLYSTAELRQGYKKTMGSIGKNFAFDRVAPGESLKIRNLMERWDILKDASHELYESAFTVELSKRHKWLSPYNLTQRTEYVNQAPLMIALMLHTPVRIGGKDSNLWEAMDEQGNVKADADITQEQIAELRIKINQLNKRNHGNYDPNSPLELKKNWIGRALGQFRTWMFEGYAARFESEKYDSALGVNVKGRYISIPAFFGDVGIPTAALEIMKGIAKFQTFGALFKDTNFDQVGDTTVDNTDAANMRRVVAEAVIYIDIYLAYAILSMFAGELDDDDKFLINHVINQGLRLRTDLTFYVSPAQFKTMLKDPLPSASLIKDVGEWGDSLYDLLLGKDKIKTGVNADSSKALRETSQMFPILTQGYRIINYGNQVFDKN